MNLGHQLTVFQRDFCETVVTKIYAVLKIRKSSLFYRNKRVMIRNHFWVIHNREDYHRKHPAGTRRPGDVH